MPSKFWGDVATGFGPAYAASQARADRLKAGELAQANLLEQRRIQAEANRLERDRLEAARKESLRRWNRQEQERKDKIVREQAVADRLKAKGLEDIRGKLAASGIPQQQEGFKEIGGFRVPGLEQGMDARTLTPTPEQFKGLSRGDLVMAQMKATELQKPITETTAQRAKLEVELEHKGNQAYDFLNDVVGGTTASAKYWANFAPAADSINMMRSEWDLDEDSPRRVSRATAIAMHESFKAAKLKHETTAPDTQTDRDNKELAEIAADYDGADPKTKAILLRKAQLILSGRLDAMPTPTDTEKWLQSGQVPVGGVAGVDPPTETATEKAERTKRLAMLKSMDELLLTAKAKDWTGFVPGLESDFFDKILPIAGIDKYANIARLEFRNTLGPTAYSIAREMLQEARMTDKDWIFLKDFTPLPTDEKPEVIAKLQAVSHLVRAKLSIADKRAGRADLFSLEPVDFFNQVDTPNAKFGGAITVPSEIAPAVIRYAPQFQYIGGDKSKPVTRTYVLGLLDAGNITPAQAQMWLKNAPGVFRRK